MRSVGGESAIHVQSRSSHAISTTKPGGGAGMEHVAARKSEPTDQERADREVAIAARLALLEARFGTAFADDGAKVARGAIAEAVQRDEQLRRVELVNADEPVGQFVPYRPVSRGVAE
jgi:hypothetical protein